MNFFDFFRLRKAQPAPKPTPAPRTLIDAVVRQQETTTRRDIGDWQMALREARNPYAHRQTRLQQIYRNISQDALLSSQMMLRTSKVLQSPWVIDNTAGDANEEAKQVIADSMLFDSLTEAVMASLFYGHSLIEFTRANDGQIEVNTLPRPHVQPSEGIFYRTPYDIEGIKYRQLQEYGRWIVEVGTTDPDDFGLLNAAVPHVLMKRYAQSCWSELCEVYGIPPMVVKTNTQDPEMVARIKAMFSEQGSNSRFLTDTTEEVEWASGMQTNGDVFSNLIALCNSEISLVISGAQVGQDTQHGNRSKEESSAKLLDAVVESDKRYIEAAFNRTLLPALARLGVVPEGLRLRFEQVRDLDTLWAMSVQAMPFYNVSAQWIKDTFGIEIESAKNIASVETQDLASPDKSSDNSKDAKNTPQTDELGKDDLSHRLDGFFA